MGNSKSVAVDVPAKVNETKTDDSVNTDCIIDRQLYSAKFSESTGEPICPVYRDGLMVVSKYKVNDHQLLTYSEYRKLGTYEKVATKTNESSKSDQASVEEKVVVSAASEVVSTSDAMHNNYHHHHHSPTDDSCLSPLSPRSLLTKQLMELKKLKEDREGKEEKTKSSTSSSLTAQSNSLLLCEVLYSKNCAALIQSGKMAASGNISAIDGERQDEGKQLDMFHFIVAPSPDSANFDNSSTTEPVVKIIIRHPILVALRHTVEVLVMGGASHVDEGKKGEEKKLVKCIGKTTLLLGPSLIKRVLNFYDSVTLGVPFSSSSKEMNWKLSRQFGSVDFYPSTFEKSTFEKVESKQ